MNENHNKSVLKKLFDRLQEDSWQLELLVSGFTIFGLFYALKPVGDALDKASHEQDILFTLYFIVYAAIFILILNLIIHVILRSLWIGALGLRYVSGDVDIDKLNYGKHFTNYLKKKVGSFDSYIEKLEKLCSIIFAISFLLIFYVAAVFILNYLLNFIGSFHSNVSLILLQNTINSLILLGAVLTFIDYITQGLLKKNKWVSKIYFPFYWVFSYLTLSFLYRPLYYNLIDNKFGRRISFMLLPFYFSVLLITNIYKEQSGFINLYSVSSNTIQANSKNYEDLVEKDDLFINVLCIQSKIITDSYIKVKIPLTRYIENNLMKFNESLRSCQDTHRYKFNGDLFGFTVESTFKGNTDSLHLEFLKTFQNVYRIKIDSVPYNSDFVIAYEQVGKNLKIGFETYIGTGDLEEGKHILVYYRPKHPETDSIRVIKEIPFWYYKK